MKGSSAWHFYCFVLLFALAFDQSNSTEPTWGHKYFVRFINNINNVDVLNFMCESDNDTVRRQLAPNQQWEFGFRLTIGTLWECWVWYLQSSNGGKNQTANFFGHKAEDVPDYHGVHAIWSARQTGIWLHNDHTDQWTLKYPWGYKRVIHS